MRRCLGPLSDLEPTGTRGYEELGEGHGLFVVRRGAALYGYRNRCPHTGAPLEWQPHRFLDADGHYVQCALHGALFRVEDGYCLRGPCAGQSLEPVEVGVDGGWVVLIEV